MRTQVRHPLGPRESQEHRPHELNVDWQASLMNKLAAKPLIEDVLDRVTFACMSSDVLDVYQAALASAR